MAFSTTQLRALQRELQETAIRTRQATNGRELSYIEGWHAIAEASLCVLTQRSAILVRHSRTFFHL
jgi:hypothetical protein